MKNLYIIIDVQNDFISGTLGSEQAHKSANNICSFISNINDDIILTVDIHDNEYLNTLEGIHLPKIHCQSGTWGSKLYSPLLSALDGKEYKIVSKNSFGCPKIVDLINQKQPKNIIFMGICSDICVITNALMIKANFPDIPIFIKSSCMAGTTYEKHKQALSILESCQIFDLDK